MVLEVGYQHLQLYRTYMNFLQNREGLNTCSVFSDLSKAFDILNHQMLLWKLDRFCGIGGLPHKLLPVYL